jgi:hypothetical protein
MRMKVAEGDRVLLAGGGKATVRKVLDDGQACVLDVDGMPRRPSDPEHLVLIKALMPAA